MANRGSGRRFLARCGREPRTRRSPSCRVARARPNGPAVRRSRRSLHSCRRQRDEGASCAAAALDVALLRVDTGTSPLEQRAVSAAALHVLVDSRSAPVLLAIDDLQWLDRPTVNVLRFALRRIAARRRARCEPLEPVRRRSARAGEALPPRVDRLTVAPLDMSALDHVLRSRLRTAFLGPTLRRLHETSGGNPPFAIELARSLLDPDASWVPGQPFPAPSSLPELLAARLAHLTADAVLLAASALARPTVDLVLEATASDGGTRSLDQAVEAEVVAVHGGAVRFTHPLLVGRVRRCVSKRAVPLAPSAGQSRCRPGRAGPASRPQRRRTRQRDRSHARASSPASGVTRRAPDAAAVLLEQAVDLTPASSRDDVPRRKLDAADQHIAAGDTARARALLDSVLSMADAGTIRARALHRCCARLGIERRVPRCAATAAGRPRARRR